MCAAGKRIGQEMISDRVPEYLQKFSTVLNLLQRALVDKER